MYKLRPKDWQIKSKDELLTLDQNQLDLYVQSFVKLDETVADSDSSSSDSPNANERCYI